MNRELAVSSLKAVKEVFDEFGIEFWLDCGTLLGAIREGKIIEWDTDIDLSMWNYDEKKLFLALRELKRRKFKLTVWPPLHPNIGTVRIRLFPFDCFMSISLWQVKDDELVNLGPILSPMWKEPWVQRIFAFLAIVRHYLYCDLSSGDALDLDLPVITSKPSLYEKQLNFIEKILEHSLPLLPLKTKTLLLNILQRWKLGYVNWLYFTPKPYFERLETTKFYGLTFHIPFDVENYLKYHYGENWKVPQKKWDWLKDDRSKIDRSNDSARSIV